VSNTFEVTRLLWALDLPESRVGKVEIMELNCVLTTEYRSLRALPDRGTLRELSTFAKASMEPRHPVWKKWVRSGDFRLRLFGPQSQEIVIHTAPYTVGAGLLLWGFSCDVKSVAGGAFVIFLNTAHQLGAIATAAVHELGHYACRSFESDGSRKLATHSTNFTTHLTDKAELFSDSLVALSAYAGEAIRQVRHHNASSGAAKWLCEMRQADKIINADYRMDFARKALSPGWRIRYLTATIHFFKLRKALLDIADI